MAPSETFVLLKAKVTKILFLLLLVRLGLYIPVPNIDLDLFSQNQNANPIFGFAKTLTGSSFLGIGALGILPYINASIIIQLLLPFVPKLEQLQKEEGEYGRQQITRYTRYLAFLWAIFLSTGISFFLVKPIVFDWSLSLGFQIVLALTTGSILSMWFAELITEEGLGNGSSMLIFINIVGSIPTNFKNVGESLFSNPSFLGTVSVFGQGLLFYILIVTLIVVFQDAYKKIAIVSAKQLNVGSQQTFLSDLASSYIPLKINQGGIMPLVFSSTIAIFLSYPVQLLLSSVLNLNPTIANSFLSVYSVVLNIVLVLFFSRFYAVLVLKPEDISQNLAKMAYSIPNVRQGKETTKYLEKRITRLAFIGGLFLSFLAFFPILVSNFFQINIFKNVTSLLILIGVITDVISQIRGYLVARKYEGFKQ